MAMKAEVEIEGRLKAARELDDEALLTLEMPSRLDKLASRALAQVEVGLEGLERNREMSDRVRLDCALSVYKVVAELRLKHTALNLKKLEVRRKLQGRDRLPLGEVLEALKAISAAKSALGPGELASLQAAFVSEEP